MSDTNPPVPPPGAGQLANYRWLLRWLFAEPPVPQEREEKNDERMEKSDAEESETDAKTD